MSNGVSAGVDTSPLPGWAIGIDVGGTKIAAGLVHLADGQVHARRRIPTLAVRGSEAVFSDILELAGLLKSRAADLGVDVGGIGVGVCELVGPDEEVLSDSLLDWRDLPIRRRLSTIAPTVVEADVRAAALAEAIFGAGQSLRSFVYVTIGTGISCSLVIDGKPYPGARGAAGTFASRPWSFPCANCGTTDSRSLEDIASGPGLLTRYNQAAPRAALSAEAVLAAAAAGDEIAAAIVESATEALGTAIGLLVNITDPQAVVLGGGLGLAYGVYHDRLAASARARVWWEGHRTLPILKAQTGEDAGLIGAASAWQRATFGRPGTGV